MFKELAPHLEKMNLSISLSMKGDKITFSILPKSKEKDKPFDMKPLTGTGLPEELDAEFPGIISKTFDPATEQLANISTWLDSVGTAAKKATEPAKTTTTTTSKSSTPAKEEKKPERKFEPDKLEKADKKIWDSIKAKLDASKSYSDTDRIDYQTKAALKEAEGLSTGKLTSQKDLAIAYITEQFATIRQTLVDHLKTPVSDGIFAGTGTQQQEPTVEEQEDNEDDDSDSNIVDVDDTDEADKEEEPPARAIEPETKIAEAVAVALKDEKSKPKPRKKIEVPAAPEPTPEPEVKQPEVMQPVSHSKPSPSTIDKDEDIF
jgi:PRTRC genetic system protein E